MADFNQITISGRLGKDVEIRATQDGREVASFTVATDDGFKNRETDKWVPRLNWHKVFTFQEGLIKKLRNRGKKGARAFVQGEMVYRTWRKDGEDSDRREAEIQLGPNSTLNFIDPLKSDPE